MAYAYEHRTFCRCLPLRFGVLIFSFLGLVGGVLVLTSSIIQAEEFVKVRSAFIVTGVVHGVVALFALFGFIGAIRQNRQWIVAYLPMQVTSCLISIASGIFVLFVTFKHKEAEVKRCQFTAPDIATANLCDEGVALVRDMLLSLFIVTWLISIWGCVVTSQYKDQLNAEEGLQQGIEAGFKEIGV